MPDEKSADRADKVPDNRSSALHAWLTPGTITSIISTILMIGSFVGVSKYRAEASDKRLDQFETRIEKQLARYDTRMDGFERKIDNMSKENLENVRLQARFEALEKDLNRAMLDNRELNGKVQAQWDALQARLGRMERTERGN